MCSSFELCRSFMPTPPASARASIQLLTYGRASSWTSGRLGHFVRYMLCHILRNGLCDFFRERL